MTIPLLDQIAVSWYQVFGGGFVFMMVLLGMVSIIMFAFRMPRSAVLIILVPFVCSVAYWGSTFLEIPRFIGIIVWPIVGLVVAGVFWQFLD